MHVQGMLQGWFFTQGDIGAWLAGMLKGKHAHVLRGISINGQLSGKALAWCASPTDADGNSMYLPPIDQGVHVPFHSKKAVQGLFVTPTVKFLTQKLAEQGHKASAVRRVSDHRPWLPRPYDAYCKQLKSQTPAPNTRQWSGTRPINASKYEKLMSRKRLVV